MSMEKRKKTRELSEEVRHKIVAKHGQSQGYKSISRDLNVPVSTVRNIIRKFKADGTVANLPGRGRKRKLDQRLQRRIVQMVEKVPQSTEKQMQLTPSVTNSMKGGSVGGYPGEPHRWERHTRKPEWSLPKHTCTSQNPSGRMSCGQMRPNYSFLLKNIISMFTETKGSLQSKEHLLYSQTWRRFPDVLGLLCCLWYWVPWMCARHHEIRRLPRHFGAQCSTQCQKAGSPSKVMGLAAGH